MEPKRLSHIHKNPVFALILLLINRVRTLKIYLFKIHFNIIRHFTFRSSKRCVPFRFPHQNSLCPSHPCMPHFFPILPFFNW